MIQGHRYDDIHITYNMHIIQGHTYDTGTAGTFNMPTSYQ